MVGHDGLVILPPATEGEGLGDGGSVHIKRDGKFRADFRLDAQQLQHMGIGGGLVGALLGQAALHRVAVHPVGLVGVGVAHLHMGLIEGDLRGHSHKAPQAPLVNKGVLPQLIELLFRQILEAAVAESAHLAEVGLLEALVDGQGDGKEGGKQHCGQRDSQHGHDVAGLGRPQAFQGQVPDTFPIGDVHAAAPLTV